MLRYTAVRDKIDVQHRPYWIVSVAPLVVGVLFVSGVSVTRSVWILILRAKTSWNSSHEKRYGEAGERPCRRPPPDLGGGR